MITNKAKNDHGKFLTRKDKRHRAWPAGTNTKGFKQIFNRKLRKNRLKLHQIKNGCEYKKYNCSYNINDFK